MHFDILSYNRKFFTGVELVKADTIEIKRKPSQIFRFTNVESFLDAINGWTSAVVYVGKDSEDSEKWKAYYWEPAETKKEGYMGERSILPPGSLAILEMDEEDDLEWALKLRQDEARKYKMLFKRLSEISRKIRDIDFSNKFADEEQFEFMTVDELEKVVQQAEEEYKRLVSREKAEI